jgi:Winged helix-turn helix
MYREVTMIEVREVLRLRGEGLPKKRIAAQLGLDPKTVRRYLEAAATAGVAVTATISDEAVRQVLLALHPAGGRPRGDGWARCVEQRAAIERWLGDGLRLTKIRKLLVRQGVEIAYPTLHRFAVLELQFGKTATTIPVLDGEPGYDYGESRVMVSA